VEERTGRYHWRCECCGWFDSVRTCKPPLTQIVRWTRKEVRSARASPPETCARHGTVGATKSDDIISNSTVDAKTYNTRNEYYCLPTEVLLVSFYLGVLVKMIRRDLPGSVGAGEPLRGAMSGDDEPPDAGCRCFIFGTDQLYEE
jgi:hypothetical protein